MKTAVMIATAASSALLLGGCGLGGSSGGNTQTPPPEPTHHHHPQPKPPVTVTVIKTAPATPTSQPPTSRAPSTSPAMTSPAGGSAPECASPNLVLSLGQTQGSAGSSETPVILTNHGSATCSVTAYPGVSYLNAAGDQIGQPASRVVEHHHTVTIAPGDSASALLRQPDPDDYDASQCQPKTSSELRVYPPDNQQPLTIADRVRVCGTSVGPAEIGPMEQGTDPTS